jgi:hypothetical protein
MKTLNLDDEQKRKLDAAVKAAEEAAVHQGEARKFQKVQRRAP